MNTQMELRCEELENVEQMDDFRDGVVAGFCTTAVVLGGVAWGVTKLAAAGVIAT